MTKMVLVAKSLDISNLNAQSLNAKAFLARFAHQGYKWIATHYATPDPVASTNSQVQLVKLWRWRFMKWRMLLFYLQPADALFYPGGIPFVRTALKLRKWLYPNSPVIATLEELAGTVEREQQLSELAGHPVYCHRYDQEALDNIDEVLKCADHIIAISPFLAKIGTHLYGDKFSVIPLGVDTSVFYPYIIPKKSDRVRVVSAGTFQSRKRPDLFLELARRHPEVDFTWYGNGGTERDVIIQKAAESNAQNIEFPGGLPPARLSEEFREADLFVMPSRSEGVPKVTQEAAACGLPIVLFGYYEAHSVVHGENGYVAWNDEEFMQAVTDLIKDRDKMKQMGQKSAEMAKEWNWDVVARQWEEKLLSLIN